MFETSPGVLCGCRGICPRLRAILCMWWACGIGWVVGGVEGIQVAGGQAPLGDPIWGGVEWPRLSPVWGWLIEDEREGGRGWGCYWIWPLPHIQYMPHTHTQTRQGVIQKPNLILDLLWHIWMRVRNICMKGEEFQTILILLFIIHSIILLLL